MKKFLIIGAVFVVLVLGIVAQQLHVEVQDRQVTPSTIESRQPRLTKSQKIEQSYQPIQNSIGEIPVIFEQVATADIAVKPIVNPIFESQSQIVASTPVLSKTEPNMNESINLLAHQIAGQMAPISHFDQSEPEMDEYPFELAPDQHCQPSKALKSVMQNQPQELLQDEGAVLHEGDDEPWSSKRFAGPHRSLAESYQPTSVVATPVALDVSDQQKSVETPVEQTSQKAVNPSLLGRVKNRLSKIPKWLYGLPLVAGAYAMLKKDSAQLDVPVNDVPVDDVLVNPESEKIDMAGHAHDKLKEVQDEYLKKDQASQEEQPSTVVPEAPITPYQQDPVLEHELPVVATQDPIVQQGSVPTAALDSEKYIAPRVSGAFSSTRTLLSPVRSLDRVDQTLEESTPVVVETAVTSVVPVVPIVSALDVAVPQPGIARKAVSDCYNYFARRLSSPLGVLTLATKAAVIGLQFAPVVCSVRQAHIAQHEELMLEGAIEQVARTIKPIDIQPSTILSIPVEGAPSYTAQLASGNVVGVVRQLATQFATLRLATL